MPQTLTITDETALGKVLNQLLLDVQKEVITVADLIQMRVKQEIDDYNRRLPDRFQGLVQPNQIEQILNDKQPRQRYRIDPEKQTQVALQAFEQNGFFILVNNRQVETLDEEILLTDDTKVSFVKLTPLIGG